MRINISNIAKLPTRFGDFKIQTFAEGIKEHLVIFKEPLSDTPTVRVHSECLTGDAIGSLKCDCRDQLEYALHEIEKEGGIIEMPKTSIGENFGHVAVFLDSEGNRVGLHSDE